MGKFMIDKDKDNYKVLFSGATISKKEANKVGIALIFAMVGAVLIYFTFGIENKTAVFFICLALSSIGYFGIANKIIKNENGAQQSHPADRE
jgi:preprotein translocase subunit SecF